MLYASRDVDGMPEIIKPVVKGDRYRRAFMNADLEDEFALFIGAGPRFFSQFGLALVVGVTVAVRVRVWILERERPGNNPGRHATIAKLSVRQIVELRGVLAGDLVDVLT